MPRGTALPSLGLTRVTILTTPGTCSASEAVINALRGVDVQVNLIGGATCGKPYGFTPVPNCGTTYFSIEFKGVNAKGVGDYDNGFAPTCAVADDLTRELGDTSESLLATALSYRANGVCPAQARTSVQAMAARTQVRPTGHADRDPHQGALSGGAAAAALSRNVERRHLRVALFISAGRLLLLV